MENEEAITARLLENVILREDVAHVHLSSAPDTLEEGIRFSIDIKRDAESGSVTGFDFFYRKNIKERECISEDEAYALARDFGGKRYLCFGLDFFKDDIVERSPLVFGSIFAITLSEGKLGPKGVRCTYDESSAALERPLLEQLLDLFHIKYRRTWYHDNLRIARRQKQGIITPETIREAYKVMAATTHCPMICAGSETSTFEVVNGTYQKKITVRIGNRRGAYRVTNTDLDKIDALFKRNNMLRGTTLNFLGYKNANSYLYEGRLRYNQREWVSALF